MESAFLLSYAEDRMLWNSNRCSRYSTHSEMGIFLESNIVPVSGLNLFLQPLQTNLCMPSLVKPFLDMRSHSQYGQDFGWLLFMKSISSLHCLRCLARYHSMMVDSTSLSPSSLSLFADHEKRLKGRDTISFFHNCGDPAFLRLTPGPPRTKTMLTSERSFVAPFL